MSLNFGTEMSIKLKNAIKLRLSEFNAYVDDELPDYVLVMLANRRTKETMLNDLKLFLGANTMPFIDWLHELLDRLQQPPTESSSLDTNHEKPVSRRTDKKGKRKGESSDEGKRNSSDSKASHHHLNVDIVDTAIDRDEFAEELDRYKQAESVKSDVSKPIDSREQRHLSTSKSHHHSRPSEKTPSKSSLERSPPSSSHHPLDISMTEQESSARIREARVAPMVSEVESHHMESLVKIPARPRLGLGTYALIQRALREATADSQQIAASRQALRNRLGEEKVPVTEKMDVDSSYTTVDHEKPVKPVSSSPTKRKGADLTTGTSESSHTTFVVTMNATPSDLENKKTAENDMSASVVRTVCDRRGVRTIVVEKNMEKERLSSGRTDEDKISVEDISPVRKRLRKSTSSDRSGELDDMDQLEELTNAKLEAGSIKERCKFWPLCRNYRNCPYLHPTEPCKTFPNCIFGNKCYYIHPPCRYQAHCTNDQCPYLHTTYRSPYPTYPHSRPYGHTPYYSRPQFAPRVFGPTSLSVTRFHAPIQSHEQIRCKFFPQCNNPRCAFWHPLSKGGAVSAHKWVSPHLDQSTANVNHQTSADTVNSVSDASVM